MLARLVELLGKEGREGHDERRAAFNAIVEHVNRRSATMRLEDGRLSLEGVNAPQDVPFVRSFVRQLVAHQVGEIQFSFRAAPVDIILVLRLLAGPPGSIVRQRLEQTGATSVTVRTMSDVETTTERRQHAVTDGMLNLEPGTGEAPSPAPAAQHAQPAQPVRPANAAGSPLQPPVAQRPEMPSPMGASPQPPREPRAPARTGDFVPAKAGAAYGQMIELHQAAATTLAAAVRRLKGHPDVAEVSKGLNAVAVGVTNAVRDKRVPEAIDAIIAVVKQEDEENDEEVRLRYGVALRRILQSEVLQPLIEYLLDPLYKQDVALIMRRAGAKGTEILLDLLVAAPTFAERKAFMEALRQIELGTEMVVGMLNHPEWFVVRNVADLVGELRIEEGITGLGQAGRHADKRVRLSAGLALAKIGTPSAFKHLGNLLRDPEPEVRLEIAKHVGGKELAPLAMPLVNAADSEELEEVQAEFYRALGRIGTTEAVVALIQASKPVSLLKQRKVATKRQAATEGLALAGGERALDTLRVLANDRDRHVRETARSALLSATTLPVE